MEHDEARQKARREFDQIEFENPHYRGVVIQDEYTVNHGKAWVLVFETREYLETGSAKRMHFPNVYIVPKNGGEAYFAPAGRDLFEYLDSL